MSDNVVPTTTVVYPMTKEESLMMIDLAVTDNPLSAWIESRHDSSWWQRMTELAFAEKHLPRLRVDLYKCSSLARHLDFDRLSDDGTRAIFRVQDPVPHVTWHPVLDHDLPIYYHHVLMLEGIAINDTPLYEYQQDWAAREVSFDWIPTFNYLFDEEVKLRQILEGMVDNEFRRVMETGVVGQGPDGEKTMKKAIFHTMRATKEYREAGKNERFYRFYNLGLLDYGYPLPEYLEYDHEAHRHLVAGHLKMDIIRKKVVSLVRSYGEPQAEDAEVLDTDGYGHNGERLSYTKRRKVSIA
ncbi:hypothetical protein F5X96DRAFT_689592 [Biscogniauxia mediterranea]|nr:hypothetical protein F5X96DRAFT_689592 [Biscogniauxia mediterranea]